jgi:integrase
VLLLFVEELDARTARSTAGIRNLLLKIKLSSSKFQKEMTLQGNSAHGRFPLLNCGEPNGYETIFREICALAVEDNGLRFDSASVKAQRIKEDADYEGVRVTFLVYLKRARIHLRRGIVEQVVGDVKTEGSARSFPFTGELLERLKVWKQRSDFSGAGDWIFASPVKIGRLPYSYTGVWRELVRATEAAKIGHLGTHAFRHTYRSWLDAVGTPVAVQQKMMRHSNIRTTFNIYGDVVTDEMTTAGVRVAKLAFEGIGAQTERNGS